MGQKNDNENNPINSRRRGEPIRLRDTTISKQASDALKRARQTLRRPEMADRHRADSVTLNPVNAIRGFHALWTKPNPKRQLSELEILTAALSALMYRRHIGPIVLHTDALGAEVAAKTGLCHCYDQVRVELDTAKEIENLNPQTFWAAGKLAALATHKAPVVMLDMDVILWNRPALDNFTVLATDDPSWPGSQWKPPLNFDLGPFPNLFNCGTVFFKSDAVRKAFARLSIEWMTLFSRQAKETTSFPRCHEYAMLYAEQRVLESVFFDHGIKPAVLCKRKGRLPFLAGAATHLWNCKQVYRQCSTYADAVSDYVIALIERSFSGYQAMLEYLPPRREQFAPGALPGEPDVWWTRTLTNVGGYVTAHNPHFPISREIHEGGKLYFGEYLSGRGHADVLFNGGFIMHYMGVTLDADEIWKDTNEDHPITHSGPIAVACEHAGAANN